MRDTRLERLTLAAFIAVIIIGGLNFVGVRFSNRELPPFWGAGIRFVAAGLLLGGLMLAQRLPVPRGRALAGAFAYGVLGFGGSYAFGYWALQEVPAGMAAVMLSSAPLFTLLLALLHGQERFRWQGLAGGLIALAGIAIMFLRSVTLAVPTASLLGMVAMMLCFSEAAVVAKLFPRSHPVSTNAIAMGTGAVILLAVSAVAGETWALPRQASTWIALGYLVLLGSSVVFILFLFILRRWSASATAYQFVLFPLVAVTVGSWLERTPVTLPMIAGGALILGGVYVGAIAQAAPVQAHARMGSEPCTSCPT